MDSHMAVNGMLVLSCIEFTLIALSSIMKQELLHI